MPDSKIIFPAEIILEVTNACNLRCKYCHFHSPQAVKKRKTSFMPRAIWARVLQDLQDQQQPVSLLTHGAGEPLLHPELYEILQRARRIQGVSLGFMTNGMLLDAEWSKRLVDLQLDFLALSIDGTVPDTHDYFRSGADLKKIERNVLGLIQEKERQGSTLPELGFNMVCYPEIQGQVEDYVFKWLPSAGQINISRFRPVGSRRLWSAGQGMQFRPCPLLYKQMVIGVDGRVGLCCEDINLQLPVGLVQENGIREIYNSSSVLQRYRRLHEQGKISGLDLCRDCHIWGGDVPLETAVRTIRGIQVQQQITPAFQFFQRM